jgi:hypothetical protein
MLRVWLPEMIDVGRRKEETPRGLIAGSLLTRLLRRGPTCIGGLRGAGFPSSLHQQSDKARAHKWFEQKHCNGCNARLRYIQEREMHDFFNKGGSRSFGTRP